MEEIINIWFLNLLHISAVSVFSFFLFCYFFFWFPLHSIFLHKFWVSYIQGDLFLRASPQMDFLPNILVYIYHSCEFNLIKVKSGTFMNAGQSTFFDANSLVYSYNSWCLGRNRQEWGSWISRPLCWSKEGDESYRWKWDWTLFWY